MAIQEQRLSILHVLLQKGFGGSGRYCLDLAMRQREAGHRVGVVLRPRRFGEGPSFYDFIPSDMPRYLAWRPFEAFSVAGAIGRFKPDVLHAHVGWSARAVGAIPRRPAAVTTLHLRYRAKESAKLDGVIRIADWQAGDMAGYQGCAETISNWLPHLPEVSPAEVAAARRQAGASADEILIGFVGRLHEVKGADLLVRAFRQCAPANARLALVGDGPERDALEALAAGDPRVVFVGNVANPAPWYRAFNLLVIPSRFEPFGLVALEGMDAGAPILASDTEGLGEVLRPTSAALVPPRDEGALAYALSAFFDRCAAEGPPPRSAYDLSRYCGELAVKRVERFYRQVIARRSPVEEAVPARAA